jgi:hypothetical protein
MARYTIDWRNRFLPEANCMDSLIAVFQDAQNRLEKMREHGVELTPLGDDYYLLHTNDSQVAEHFYMEEDNDHDHGGEAGEGS